MRRSAKPLSDHIAARSRPEGECVVWTGVRRPGGYGNISVNGKMKTVHRLVYELAWGSIPAGLVVRHSCDNPPCIRLDHLLLGTQKENLADRQLRGRPVGPPKGRRNPRRSPRAHRPKVSEGTPHTVAFVLWDRHMAWLAAQNDNRSAAVRRAIDAMIAAEQQAERQAS